MAIYPDRKDAMSGLFSKTAKAVGRNGLSYRLLSYILVCSTVLAMIITVLQLAWDYRKDVAVIEDSIGQIEASFLQPIAASLWNLDEEQVKVQIEGIMNLPNMQFVMVKEMLGNSEVPLLTQGWSGKLRHLPRVQPHLSGRSGGQAVRRRLPRADLPAPH